MEFEQMKRLNTHINTKIYMIHSKLDDFIHVVATLITNYICNTFKIVIINESRRMFQFNKFSNIESILNNFRVCLVINLKLTF